MKEFRRPADKFASAMAQGKRYYVQSPFKFIKAGKASIDMNEGFAHFAQVADEICVYRGMHGESINHPTACYHMNTGNRFGGDPAMGSWVTYGLGSPNRNLPAFVVMPEVNFPQGGAANWANGFLPAYYQGTSLRSKGSPILDLTPPKGVTRDQQRKNLDLLSDLNAGDGIQARFGSNVQRNTARENGGAGLHLEAGSAYRENVVTTLPVGSTVTGSGVDMGNNSCNGNTTCP